MKKNRMMRAASAMLLAVLLTTCAISGTFAKYTTTAEANDSARVAKWGITAEVTGNAFSNSYEADNKVTLRNGTTLQTSVQSDDNANVVAPGTSGTFATVELDGNPEVAVNIEHEAHMTLSGWEVVIDDAGTKKFYCPITITLSVRHMENGVPAVDGEGKPVYDNVTYCGLDYPSKNQFAAAIADAIEQSNGNYAANASIEDLETYSWAWAFTGATGSEINQTDAYDTQLGNAATSNTISLVVDTTVTQID